MNCELCKEMGMKEKAYKEYDGLILCKSCYYEIKQDKAIQILE